MTTSRRLSRVYKGITNNVGAGPSEAAETGAFRSPSQRPATTVSVNLTAKLSGRALGGLSSAPILTSATTSSRHPQRDDNHEDLNAERPPSNRGKNLFPRLEGCTRRTPPRPQCSSSPRPATNTGATGRFSARATFLREEKVGQKSRYFTPPRTSPGMSHRGAQVADGSGSHIAHPEDTDAGVHGNSTDNGGEDIPLGLNKLDRKDLEVCLDVVRARLAQKARQKHPLRALDRNQQAPKSTVVSGITGEDDDIWGWTPSRDGGRGIALDRAEPTKDRRSQQGRDGRSHHHRNHYHRHHSHHHKQRGHNRHRRHQRKGAQNWDRTSVSNIGSVDGDMMSRFARSKGSRTMPLRTLMLDPEVSNIPKVRTQSDFQAVVKTRNVPHESYDIDGDGVVSPEDYAMAKRFDLKGGGILDEAQQVIGRRIIAELFLEKHKHNLHLYSQELAQKSTATNIGKIARSHGFETIMSRLREREKDLANRSSDGMKECMTLGPGSLTRHNVFSNKFDTTAGNDLSREPRCSDWLNSPRQDGSRSQMYYMRKMEARKSAHDKLMSRSTPSDKYCNRRITLITNPAVENS